MSKKFELLREAVGCYKANHVSGDINEKALLEFIDELEAINFTGSSLELPSKDKMYIELKNQIDLSGHDTDFVGKQLFNDGFKQCYYWLRNELTH